MYNLYIYEKQKRDEENRKNTLIKSQELSRKRKLQVEDLSSNYRERVKNFISDMTLPGHQIRFNNDKVIANTREELLHQGEIRRNFIFKGYKTEKERIEDALKNNPYIDYKYYQTQTSPSKHTNTKSLRRSTNDIVEKGIKSINEKPLVMSNYKINSSPRRQSSTIIQPEMRFKPRTDLERVVDAVIRNPTQNQLDPSILKRHLSRLSNTKVKFPSHDGTNPNNNGNNIDPASSTERHSERKINDDPFDELFKVYFRYNPLAHTTMNNSTSEVMFPKETTTSTTLPNKASSSRNNANTLLQKYFERVQKHLTLNNEAKEILSDLHYKTHFKATVELAENKFYSRKKHKNNTSLTDNSSNNNIKKKDGINFEEDYLKHELNTDDNAVYMQSQEYTKNYNPYLVNKPKPRLNEESEGVLKELMQKKMYVSSEGENNMFENGNGSKSETKDGNNPNNAGTSKDYVKIAGKEYNKNQQMDVIAKLVLSDCNVVHEKSRYNNKAIKCGMGKLMFTNGMTIKDFEDKYNFK